MKHLALLIMPLFGLTPVHAKTAPVPYGFRIEIATLKAEIVVMQRRSDITKNKIDEIKKNLKKGDLESPELKILDEEIADQKFKLGVQVRDIYEKKIKEKIKKLEKDREDMLKELSDRMEEKRLDLSIANHELDAAIDKKEAALKDKLASLPDQKESSEQKELVPGVHRINGNMAIFWGFAHGSLRPDKPDWNACFAVQTSKAIKVAFTGAFEKQQYEVRVFSGRNLELLNSIQEVRKIKKKAVSVSVINLGSVQKFVEGKETVTIPLEPGEYLFEIEPLSKGNIGWRCTWEK